jgi:hypothetical protein
LSLPALMLLHIARPFSFFAAQGLLLCEPLVGAFGRDTTLADYAELLADRDRLDHLMSHLENASRRGERSAKEND